MQSDATYLGPFELGKPLKSGGMAVIYHGTHRQSGRHVAVKIIRPDQLSKASLNRAIRKEISTIADLDHPNIVKIFDLGEISEEQAQHAPDLLPHGAPWYVMEYVSGGSLLEAPPVKDWTEARRLMLELLDALAHAHAAGVIHRDLKPGNVLLDTTLDGSPHIKLVDFGIAQIITELGDELGELTSEHHVTGTPRYMSPEQVSGRHREHGPWTDLYAFGCLAWFILTGFPPFAGNMIQVMRSHLQEPPPPLVAQFPIPPGVEQWILKLLAKQPHQRYRHAADAAHGLMLLPALPPQAFIADDEPTSEINLKSLASNSAPHTAPRSNVYNPTLPTLSFLKKRTHDDLADDLLEEGPATLLSGSVSDYIVQASSTLPLPETWRRIEDAPSQPTVETASTGLFKFKTPPLIGRVEERDMLWEQLEQVVHQRCTRAVLIRGAEGVGKTRLLQWFTRRAEEVGACITLTARHDEQGADFDGPRQMLTSHFRCSNLKADALLRHLNRVWIDDPRLDLPRDALNMLTPWIDAFPEQNQETLQTVSGLPFHNPRYRYPHLFTLLERMSQERPLLLWFDDAHHSVESLHFALSLLDYANTNHPIRALLLLNLREESFEQGITRPLLTRLLDPQSPHNQPEASTSSLHLEALSASQHRALIQSILPLEPPLVEEIAQRTAGHPGFAFALLSDWIESGQLQPGRDGLHLTHSRDNPLPESMREVWTRRLDHALSPLPAIEQDEVLIALELASTLGRTIYSGEWRHCCALLNVSIPDGTLNRLLDAKLLLVTEQGWEFAHPILREVLQELATQRGALTQYHLHCANMLEQLYHDELPARQLRIAYHRARAGQLEEAIAHLDACSNSFYLSGEYSRALDAVEKCLELIEILEQSRGSERWSTTLMAKLQLLINLQRLERAKEVLAEFDRDYPDLTSRPRTSLRSRHEYIHLKLRMTSGHLKKTIRARDSILHACQNHPEDTSLSASLLLIANAHLLHGELDLARHLLEITQQRYASHQHKHGYALATYGLAECALILGEYEHAERILIRARALFRDSNIRSGELLCAHREIDLLRLRGQKADAQLLTTQLDQHFAQLDPPLRARHLLHKLLLALEDGKPQHASRLVEQITPLQSSLEFSDAITFQIASALHQALLNHFERARDQFAIARVGLNRSELCTIQLATLLELLGHLTRDSEPQLSEQSLALAKRFLSRLGAPSRLEHAPAARHRPPRKKS